MLLLADSPLFTGAAPLGGGIAAGTSLSLLMAEVGHFIFQNTVGIWVSHLMKCQFKYCGSFSVHLIPPF